MTVAVPDRAYDVTIGAGLLQHADEHLPAFPRAERAFVVAASGVAARYLEPRRPGSRGPASEIVRIHRLEIHCDPGNIASASIPRKLGFTHEGTLRAKTPFLEHWSDSMVWGLLEEEYPNTPSCKAEIKVFDARGSRLL